MKRNMDVRTKAAEARVRLWEIGAELNLTDGNFSRKLRKELSTEEKERIFSIIERLRVQK